MLRSDAIDVLRGLGERRFGGIVQLMSGGRSSLLDAVQRLGVRAGVKLSLPLSKPFTRDVIQARPVGQDTAAVVPDTR